MARVVLVKESRLRGKGVKPQVSKGHRVYGRVLVRTCRRQNEFVVWKVARSQQEEQDADREGVALQRISWPLELIELGLVYISSGKIRDVVAWRVAGALRLMIMPHIEI